MFFLRYNLLMEVLMIPRIDYMNRLIDNKDLNVIKVVSGVRRCGKSTLFDLFKEYLIELGVNEKQIISVNFEDLTFEDYRDYKSLYAYVSGQLVEGEMNYIFLDEIQHVDQFEKAVDSLYIKKNTDLYITGSNAYFMSSDLATLLSGRYIEIKMLPLSYKEYALGLKNQQLSKEEMYRSYIENSSFPYTVEISNRPKVIREYLQGIYTSVLLKDVVARYKIADVDILEDVTRFVFDNIGNQTSTSKIANTLTSNGRKIDVKTVEKYIRALRESLILYEAKRYNIKGKQYLKTLEKYYVVDIGLRYMLLGKRNTDVGHILENVVYLELLRRGYDVYVGQVSGLEVDFVAMGEMGIEYYQVSASVRESSTLERELASLEKIKDHYPKYLLTLDEDPIADYNGIKKMNVLDFLLG